MGTATAQAATIAANHASPRPWETAAEAGLADIRLKTCPPVCSAAALLAYDSYNSYESYDSYEFDYY